LQQSFIEEKRDRRLLLPAAAQTQMRSQLGNNYEKPRQPTNPEGRRQNPPVVIYPSATRRFSHLKRCTRSSRDWMRTPKTYARPLTVVDRKTFFTGKLDLAFLKFREEP